MEHYGRKRDRGFACSSWPGPCHWQGACLHGFVITREKQSTLRTLPIRLPALIKIGRRQRDARRSPCASRSAHALARAHRSRHARRGGSILRRAAQKETKTHDSGPRRSECVSVDLNGLSPSELRELDRWMEMCMSVTRRGNWPSAWHREAVDAAARSFCERSASRGNARRIHLRGHARRRARGRRPRRPRGGGLE